MKTERSTSPGRADATRRPAEQEAPRAAQEAARPPQPRTSSQAPAQPARQPTRSTFEAQRPPGGPALTDTQAPATNLLTENPQDANANCLDQAADWVEMASPELRARSELVFLQDTRPGAQGQSGHVAIRQGESVFDPASGQSYASMQDFQRAQPQYQEVGALPATTAHHIFSTEAGSPERAQALAEAQVPEALSRMLVADTQAPGGRELDPASVAQAEEDFAAVMQGGHLGQPNAFGQLLQTHQDDPDYLAHMIGQMNQGQRGSPLDDLVAGPSGLFILSGAGEFPASDETLQAVTHALSEAREAGTLTEGDLQNYLATAPAPWGEAISRMGFDPMDRLPEADAAMRELHGATSDYESALQAVEGRNEELAAMLANFGPALTEQQRADFISAFQNHEDNAAVYQRAEREAAELAQVVEQHGAALENAAITHPDDAQALTDALAHLADSSQAATAVEMGARIAADPESPLGQAFAAIPDFDERVMQQGLPNAAAQLLSEAATPQEGLQQLQALLSPLTEAGMGVKGGYETVQDGLAAIEEQINGGYDRLDTLVQGFNESSPFGRGMAAASLVFGAASAVGAGREGDYLTMLNGLASAGQGGLELLAGATEALTRSGRMALHGVDTAQASRFASFATRLAPALGLMANATAAAMHFNDLRDDPNIGEAVALLGDTIGVLGSAIELVPGGQPVGIVVNGVGAAISALGDATSWLMERHEFNRQQREFLEQAGVTEPLLDRLIDSDAERVGELVNELQIPPEQVQELALEMPWLTSWGNHQGLNLDNFVRMAQAFGITGEDAYELLRGLGAGSEDPQTTTHGVLYGLMRDGNMTDTPEGWLALVDQMAQYMPQEQRPGFENLERELRERLGG